jgi:hypothetical protein
MRYPTKRYRSLKLAIKELEKFVRDGQHLATGRPFEQFGDMRSREMLANWLLCIVINFAEQADRMTFTSDPIGGDGIIHDNISGYDWQAEHVYVPRTVDAATGNVEKLVLQKFSQKQAKGGAAYASGKTLVVFLDAGGGIWHPNKVARQLPKPLDFYAVWVVALQEVVVDEYVYAVTRLDQPGVSTVPVWRVRIASSFEDWTIERIQ